MAKTRIFDATASAGASQRFGKSKRNSGKVYFCQNKQAEEALADPRAVIINTVTHSRIKKRIRLLKRQLHSKSGFLVGIAFLLTIGSIGYAIYMKDRRLTVDERTYQGLLNVIAKAESNGNYNAYFGNSTNTNIDFTNMTVAEVIRWQSDFIAQGNPSSAVGRYQFINSTLIGLVEQLGLRQDQRFDQHTQDRLAIALLERRGSENYINEELTKEEFAANLAKEWAGLPKMIGDNPNDSYYAGDGLNKSRVSTKAVITVIEEIKAD